MVHPSDVCNFGHCVVHLKSTFDLEERLEPFYLVSLEPLITRTVVHAPSDNILATPRLRTVVSLEELTTILHVSWSTLRCYGDGARAQRCILARL